MPKPNVNQRVREIGWWFGTTNGSALNNSGAGQPHGSAPALTAGTTAICSPVQTVHALLGGSSVFSRGFVIPAVLEPTRRFDRVFASHCRYLSVSAHLRSAGNVDLPGQIQLFFNDLWPTQASVPSPPDPDRNTLGDWNTGAPNSTNWQEWEDWSPITVPTPPPGLSTGGAGGLRYEFRRKLGQLPANFFFGQITNLGTVDASEWGFGLYLRDQP